MLTPRHRPMNGQASQRGYKIRGGCMDLITDEPRRLRALPTWGNGHLYSVASGSA